MGDIQKLTNGIARFFKRDFKKRFLTIMSFPLFFCSLYLMDCTVFPDYKTKDKIVSIFDITQSSTNAYGVRTTRVIGYKYVTEKDFVFSTEKKKKIRAPEIEIVVTPVFDVVKSVKTGTKNIQLNSGFYGIDGVLLMAVFISLLISFAYTLLKKEISENAKLNMIYFNIFIFIIWFWMFLKFVA